MRPLTDFTARRALVAAMLLFCLMAPAAAAQQPLTREQASRALVNPDPATRRAAAGQFGKVGRMDDVAALVKALRDRDPETRTLAEAAIWEIWGRSGDREIDELYLNGVELMSYGAAGEAIKTFNIIISRKPDFAEAWNKRATLYYSIGDYAKSLHDCDEVMKRNPLHFGALAGYGLIYTQMGQPARALDYFRRALKINPNMQGVSRNIELLEQQGKEQRKNYI